MFKQDIDCITDMVPVILDGNRIELPVGINVAAALLSIGKMASRRSLSSGKPCGPHCLMGVCYECLMEINGIKNKPV